MARILHVLGKPVREAIRLRERRVLIRDVMRVRRNDWIHVRLVGFLAGNAFITRSFITHNVKGISAQSGGVASIKD